jgi:hypothetical protein
MLLEFTFQSISFISKTLFCWGFALRGFLKKLAVAAGVLPSRNQLLAGLSLIFALKAAAAAAGVTLPLFPS